MNLVLHKRYHDVVSCFVHACTGIPLASLSTCWDPFYKIVCVSLGCFQTEGSVKGEACCR